MKQLKCPICSAARKGEAAVFTADEKFQLVKCNRCGHHYTWFDQDIDLEKIYADERYKVVDNRESIFDRLLSFEYGKVIRRLRSSEKGTQAVLDFGCGKGKFLSLCKKEGWRVKGIETSLPRAQFAREKYELDVDTSYYQEGDVDGAPFDVISLFHVVEHLDKPEQLLRNLISNNLHKDGQLIIEVPNLDSWQARWAGPDWLQLDMPRHLSHFDKPSVMRIVEALGLAPIRISYFSTHVGMLGMCRTCLGLLGYNGDLIHTLKNKRSYKLYLLLALVLPVAFVLEGLASLSSKGGVMRIYAKRKD